MVLLDLPAKRLFFRCYYLSNFSVILKNHLQLPKAVTSEVGKSKPKLYISKNEYIFSFASKFSYLFC